MNVDPHTTLWIAYGILVLLGVGVFLYAKLFLIDRPDGKDGKSKR